MEVLELGPRHTPERHESDISSITDTEDGLTIIIDTIDEHGRQRNLKVHFNHVRGFRYLDEGDLIYYWESEKFRSRSMSTRLLRVVGVMEKSFNLAF